MANGVRYDNPLLLRTLAVMQGIPQDEAARLFPLDRPTPTLSEAYLPYSGVPPLRGAAKPGALSTLRRLLSQAVEGFGESVMPLRAEMYYAQRPERKPPAPQTTGEHLARALGELVPTAVGVGLATKAVAPLATRLIPGTTLGRTAAREAITSALAGGAYEAARAAGTGATPTEAIRTGAEAGPLWALGDIAFRAAARRPVIALPLAGVGAAYGAWRAEKPEEVVPYAMAGATIGAVAGAAATAPVLRRLLQARRARTPEIPFPDKVPAPEPVTGAPAPKAPPTREQAKDVLARALEGVAVGERPVATPPQLPKDLRNVNPVVRREGRRLTLVFESDVDRALFMVGRPKPSARDADYMAYLRQVFPGVSDDVIRARGKLVNQHVGAAVSGAAGPGKLYIKQTDIALRATAEAPAPEVAPPPEAVPPSETLPPEVPPKAAETAATPISPAPPAEAGAPAEPKVQVKRAAKVSLADLSPEEIAGTIRRLYRVVAERTYGRAGVPEEKWADVPVSEIAREWAEEQGLRLSDAKRQLRDALEKVFGSEHVRDFEFGDTRVRGGTLEVYETVPGGQKRRHAIGSIRLRREAPTAPQASETEGVPVTTMKKPWQMTKEDYIEEREKQGVPATVAAREHWAAVKEALTQNKDVNPVVTMDYPDLQELWQKKTAERMKEKATISRLISPKEGGTYTVRAEATLPKELAGAKPRYSYGSKQFELRFESDIDKALYIIAQPKPSKRDADYLAFCQKLFPDMTEEQLREAGRKVRDVIKSIARESEPGVLTIPKTGQPMPASVAKTGVEVSVKEKPYEGLRPGTKEWMKVWKAHPELQREMLEYAETQSATAAREIIRSLNLPKGAQVSARDLATHPAVKEGRVTAKHLIQEAKKRGLKVEGELEELFAGLVPTKIVEALKRIASNARTRHTFRPINEISSTRRSLDDELLALLPDDVHITIGKRTASLRDWLEKIDNSAALINHHIERLVTREGHPSAMRPEARKKYDSLVQRLDKLAKTRELLREPVEVEVENIRKGRYAKSIIAQMDNEALAAGDIPHYAGGEVAMYEFVAPLSKKKTPMPVVPQPTKADEWAWKHAPTLYARTLGLIRDVFGESLAMACRNALLRARIFEHEYETWLHDIFKPVLRNDESRKRITLILEGKEPITATETERNVAERLRKWYDHLFAQFGIPAERYLKDYSPRIRKYGSILRAIQMGEFGPTPPKELTFFAELERKAKGIVFPTELDALANALTYLRLGSRKKFLQPAFDAVQPFVATIHPDRKAMWDELVNSMLRRPVWEERLLNALTDEVVRTVAGELPPGTMSRFTRELSALAVHTAYMGTIGGNLMSVLKNATQQVIAICELTGNPAEGLRYWYKAYRDRMLPTGKRLIEDYCWVSKHRQFLEGLEAQLNIFRFLRPLEQVGLKLFEWTDKVNVEISYLMKLRYDLERGVPFAQAVDAANTFASNTQYLYGFDSPMLSKSSLGRMLGVLYSWPINYMRLQYKHLRRPGIGLLDMPAEKIKYVASHMAGLAITTFALSRVLGLDFSSEAPLGVWEGWMPIAYVFGGETSVPVDTMTKAINYVRTVLDPDASLADRDQALRELVNQLWVHVPFYVEGRRVYRVAKAMQDDWVVRDSYGKKVFTFGEIALPGGLMEYTPPYWLPEQVRALIGPTAEQRRRGEIIELTRKIKEDRDRLRDEVFMMAVGLMPGSPQEIQEKQRQIVELGGRPVTYADVQRRLEEAEKPATLRAAEGLRKGYQLEEPPAWQRVLRELLGGR